MNKVPQNPTTATHRPFRRNRDVSPNVTNRYDANGRGRRLVAWQPVTTAPSKMTHGTELMRDRARESSENEWTTSASLRTLGTNIIGTGILPRPKTKNAELKNTLVKSWKKFVAKSDADGVFNFYGQQLLALRDFFAVGECFIRIRPRFIEDGLPVPMQVQLLESEMCPCVDFDYHELLPTGSKVRSGIELNAIGARTHIWFYKNHPKSVEANALEYTRVPVTEVFHMFEPTRIGQLRGITSLAQTLIKQRHIAEWLDALLDRQRLANLTVGFVKRPSLTTDDPILGEELAGGRSDEITLQPATLVQLADGEDVSWSTPPQVGASHAEYLRSEVAAVASSNGVPYTMLTGDLKDVSDRTLRVTIQEFRRWCTQKQWLNVIPMMCDPVYEAFVKALVLKGDISPKDMEEALDVQWYPQGFEHLHPVQDVQGLALAVQAGFISRDDVIASRGDDPEEVDASRKVGFEREKSLGITAFLQATASTVKNAASDFYHRIANIFKE